MALQDARWHTVQKNKVQLFRKIWEILRSRAHLGVYTLRKASLVQLLGFNRRFPASCARRLHAPAHC